MDPLESVTSNESFVSTEPVHESDSEKLTLITELQCSISDILSTAEEADEEKLEHASNELAQHTEKLFSIANTEDKDDPVRKRAEQLLYNVFTHATYTDEAQLEIPPSLRTFSPLYEKTMGIFYKTLAEQNLVTPDKVPTKTSLLRIPNVSDESILGSAILSSIEDRENYEVNEKTEKANELLQLIVERSGLDFEDTLSKWKMNAYGEGHEASLVWNMMKNIETMRTMEHLRPGSVEMLQKEFGIRDFCRYPETVLIDQYDNFDNTEKPYGVVFSALDDHSGALTSSTWADTKKLYKNLDGRYLLRMFEIDRAFGIGRRLTECDRHYGDHNKISFAMFSGHGTKNSVQFGPEKYDTGLKLLKKFFTKKNSWTTVSTEDLRGPGLQRMKSYFEPNPQIVVTACDAGSEDGIVQETSEQLKATTYGQDYTGSSFPVEPVFNDKDTLVEFVTPETWRKHVGKYYKGERV